MNIETIKVLNNLKNNSLVNKKIVRVSINKLILQLIPFLYKEGYILSYKKNSKDKKTFIEITLKNFNKTSIFRNLKVCSSPSNSCFLSFKQISNLNTKRNLYVFSTSKGVMNGTECKSAKLGGILLFYC